MSESVNAELQELIQSCMRSLETLGAEEGFPPYAMTLVDGGEGDVIGVGPDPDPSNMLRQLVGALKNRATNGTLRAFGIVSDVTMTNSETGEQRDAIRVHVEHRDSGAFAVVASYEMTGSERTLGDLQLAPTQPMVFGVEPSEDPEAKRAFALEFIKRIPGFAAMHVEKCSSIAGITLAYDESSFDTNDRLLRQGWGAEPPSNPDVVVQIFGCFVGEAIRTLHGGEWDYNDENGAVYLRDVGANDVSVYPFELVRRRLEQGESASIGAVYRAIRESSES